MKRLIKLYGLYGQGLCTLVDEEDYVWASKHVWHLSCFGAVVGRVKVMIDEKAKIIRLARMVLNFPLKRLVHHLDENPLNNTRLNLIPVTSKEHGRFHTLPPFGKKIYLTDSEHVLQMLEKYREELPDADYFMVFPA
jgi:hypothetical protein